MSVHSPRSLLPLRHGFLEAHQPFAIRPGVSRQHRMNARSPESGGAARFAHLAWPFFAPSHRGLALEADAWSRQALGDWVHGSAADEICRRLAREVGRAGWVRYAVGGDAEWDVRALCLLREVFA